MKMKKTLSLLLILSSVLIIGCRKPAAETEVPEIKLEQKDFTVSDEGGTYSIHYQIINPVENGRISAEPSEDWIHDFKYDIDVITFTADANEQNQNRSAIVTIWYLYGENCFVEQKINIVQGAAVTHYDYEYVLTDFVGSYYGSKFGKNGEHNFNSTFHNMKLDGFFFIDGVSYIFDIYAPAPEDADNPLPKAGKYTLGKEDETKEMTFTPDSRIENVDNSGLITFSSYLKEGEMNISYENGNIVMEAFVVDTLGKSHHVSYNGRAPYDDYSEDEENPELTIIDRDVDFDAPNSWTTYAYSEGLEEGLIKVNISLYDMNFDSYGYYIYPGNKLSIDAIMPYDRNRDITPGTYTVSTSMETGTICPIEENFDGNGTYLVYFDEEGKDSYGFVKEGTMTIKKENGSYTVECDFVTAEGHKVTCRYTGPMKIAGLPGPFSTLTEDYTLNLEGAAGEAMYFGYFYFMEGDDWVVRLMPGDCPDGFFTEIVTETGKFEDGIPSGTYKPASGTYPKPGEYSIGKMNLLTLEGTMYVGNFDEEGIPGSYAPAITGDLVIVNNGDGTYDISFKFGDDSGNTWDGSWSGKMDMSDKSYGNSQFTGKTAISGIMEPVKPDRTK